LPSSTTGSSRHERRAPPSPGPTSGPARRPSLGRDSALGTEGAAAVRLATVHGHEGVALQSGEVPATGGRRSAEASQAEVDRPGQQPSSVT
jgi:hypothetical protein